MRLTVVTFLLLFVALSCLGEADALYPPLPGPGKRFTIGEGLTGIYRFNQKPQLGMAILRFEIYDRSGQKVTPLTLKGRSGMPSMPGAHDSGEVDFVVNRARNYLLPVNVVMPGDWEVRVTFLRDGKPVFRGAVHFHV